MRSSINSIALLTLLLVAAPAHAQLAAPGFGLKKALKWDVRGKTEF